MPITFPVLPIPPGGCCIRRFHKKFTGTRAIRLGGSFGCDSGPNTPGRFKLEVKLASDKCDEDKDPAGANVVPTGSVLQAAGHAVTRPDGFAVYAGQCLIRRPNGKIALEGEIVILDRTGTHQPPFGSETCDPRHSEGWMQCTGRDPFKAFSVRTVLVAQIGRPGKDGTARIAGVLNGSIMKCP